MRPKSVLPAQCPPRKRNVEALRKQNRFPTHRDANPLKKVVEAALADMIPAGGGDLPDVHVPALHLISKERRKFQVSHKNLVGNSATGEFIQRFPICGIAFLSVLVYIESEAAPGVVGFPVEEVSRRKEATGAAKRVPGKEADLSAPDPSRANLGIKIPPDLFVIDRAVFMVTVRVRHFLAFVCSKIGVSPSRFTRGGCPPCSYLVCHV